MIRRPILDQRIERERIQKVISYIKQLELFKNANAVSIEIDFKWTIEPDGGVKVDVGENERLGIRTSFIRLRKLIVYLYDLEQYARLVRQNGW